MDCTVGVAQALVPVVTETRHTDRRFGMLEHMLVATENLEDNISGQLNVVIVSNADRNILWCSIRERVTHGSSKHAPAALRAESRNLQSDS